MLPGFRFLLAAIVLSMSVLVFGLGAAALLRAAHEEFASTPAWRVAPEPKFARQNEAPAEEPMPVLAMLRVEPEPAQQTDADRYSSGRGASRAGGDRPCCRISPRKSPRWSRRTKPRRRPPKSDSRSQKFPCKARRPPPMTAAPAEETKVAPAEQAVSPAPEAVAPEPVIAPSAAIVPPAANTGIIATKIATLGGPPVAIETPPPAKAASARPDPDAAKKRLQARRAKERRRIALRARQAAAQQQAADPFAQPTITTRSR